MYMSLDSIDIELAPRDGRERVIQTDHRTAAEMAEDPALSTLIALIRCLNPQRFHERPEVNYHCAEEPPGFLRGAVEAASARLLIEEPAEFLDLPWEPLPVDEGAVNRMLNEAAQSVASKLVSEAGATDARVLLGQLEQGILAQGSPAESDPTDFWSTVVRLGVLAGETLRVTTGGAWVYDPNSSGTLPFTFRGRYRGEPATINPFGKALKFLREGDSEQPSFLVSMVIAQP